MWLVLLALRKGREAPCFGGSFLNANPLIPVFFLFILHLHPFFLLDRWHGSIGTIGTLSPSREVGIWKCEMLRREMPCVFVFPFIVSRAKTHILLWLALESLKWLLLQLE